MKALRQVIRAIVMAQIASDAGKGIYTLRLRRDMSARRDGYDSKEFWIRRAINMINTTRKCGDGNHVNYWVVEGPDQNGYESVLVYFDIKVYGQRYQVSFHNPVGRSGLTDLVGKGRKTRWHDKVDSRSTCEELIELLGL